MVYEFKLIKNRMEKVSQISVMHGEQVNAVVLHPAKLYLAITFHKIHSDQQQ